MGIKDGAFASTNSKVLFSGQVITSGKEIEKSEKKQLSKVMSSNIERRKFARVLAPHPDDEIVISGIAGRFPNSANVSYNFLELRI